MVSGRELESEGEGEKKVRHMGVSRWIEITMSYYDISYIIVHFIYLIKT